MKNPVSILVVEDDPDHAEILHHRISRLDGWEFSTRLVTRLEEAGQCLEEERFDLALVDLGLPDGGLFETVEVLAGRNPGAVPLVALSSCDDPEFARLQVERGAERCLSKADLTSEVLADLLNALLPT